MERLAREDRLRRLPQTARTAPHDFSTNDYLALARDPRVVAALGAGERAGATGARLLSGAAPVHADLERELARATRREAALLFSSGYLAALGAVTALAPHFACAYSDALNHACLIDGLRLSRVEKIVYAHGARDAFARDSRAKLVVTESLFGMDGDRADPAALLAALGPDDALLVDEAHALGVEGPQGAGLCATLEDPRVIVIGTLSKAFGAAGGFIAGPRAAIDYLVSAARTFVFDTALPPAIAAAALVAVRLAREADGARERLARHAGRTQHALIERGFARARSSAQPASHIAPVVFGSAHAALAAQAVLLAHGVLAPAIRPPTVPAGTSRVRISLTAAHDDADLDALFAALDRCRTLAVTS